jgi:hypothetical protein
MSTTSVPNGLTDTDADALIKSAATTALTAADSTSAARLDNLNLVQQARISRLSRTVTSLTAQYGAGSTQVAAANAAAAAQQDVVARVQIARQQVAATAPTVTATGWAVWGHVYDATSKPLSSYCVFLVDAEKNYQNAYGFEFTDATGSFALNYAGVTAAAGTTAASQSAAAAAAGGAPAAATQSAAATPTVFLAVTNANAQLVYFGAKALPLTVGAALYVDISLPAGEPVLGDLPAEIRKVALPPSTK